MGSPTACDSCLCTKPRPKWERFPRICHRSKHFSGRSTGCRPPCSSASGAGFAGNSQRTIGSSCPRTQEFSKYASQNHARNPRRRLPSLGVKVFPTAVEPDHEASRCTKENWFRDVKVFSHLSSGIFRQIVDRGSLFYLPLCST